MTDKHTPGPWFKLSHQVRDSFVITNDAGPHWSRPDHYICEATIANARLIAAAPDLLAAAIASFDAWTPSLLDKPGTDAWEALRAAIAKATDNGR